MTHDSDYIAAQLMAMTESDESRAIAAPAGTPSSPSPWLMGFSSPSSSGEVVTENTALSISAVFGGVRAIAEDVAKLPAPAYRRLTPRGKERMADHIVHRLLNAEANGEMIAFNFRQAMTACAMLYGNAYAEIEWANNGRPLALWPIEPWRVRVIRDARKRLMYEIDGGAVLLQSEDVLHITGFSLNGVVGEMLSRVGRDGLGLTIAAQKFAGSFFGNGARLSGIIQYPGTLSEQAATNLKTSFQKAHSGAGNAFGVAVLEEGSTWHQTSAEPNEAQMIETRQFQVEDVCRWLRVPPHKIQHLLRSTYSNIEHQSIEYVQDTMLPWCIRWEQEIKRKLISDRDVFVEHLFEGMLRGDIASRYSAYATARNNGWMNADEIRERENMNPLPDGQGEIYLVPLNMAPAKAMQDPSLLAQYKSGAAQGGADNAPTNNPNTVNGGTRDAIVRAHRRLFADAMRRIIRKESLAMRRAAKKPEGLPEAVEAFYATHAAFVREVLLPVIEAHQEATGRDVGAAEGIASMLAEKHVRNALEALRDASDIDALMDTWETEKPDAFAETAINGESNDS